jgi:hypothetical protein
MDWYQARSFAGFEKQKVLATLVANLILNGLIGPFIEEVYFRGIPAAAHEHFRKGFIHGKCRSVFVVSFLAAADLPYAHSCLASHDLRGIAHAGSTTGHCNALFIEHRGRHTHVYDALSAVAPRLTRSRPWVFSFGR